MMLFILVNVQNRTCTDNYLGESARRISERVIDHGGRDKKSHLFRHAVVNEHGMMTLKLLKWLQKQHV